MRNLLLIVSTLLALTSYTRAQEIEEEHNWLQENALDANYSKKYGQVFTDTILQMLSENEISMYDIGQPLTGEFDRATEAKKRLNHCHRFISPDGNFGEWGDVIAQSLDKVSELKGQLMADSAGGKAGMDLVCPRFHLLNTDERKQFWVWTLTALSLFESTCGFDTSNAINPNAVGLFQLNKHQSDRQPRALIYNRICGKLNETQIAEPVNNIMCTLDFMRDSFSGRIESAPPGLLTHAQQFERLRSRSNGIVRVLKKFKLCQARTMEGS